LLGNDRDHLFNAIENTLPLSIVLEIGAVQKPAPLGAFLRSGADCLLHLGVAGPPLNALLDSMRRKPYRFHSAPAAAFSAAAPGPLVHEQLQHVR
jgi:hypothetical protein